MPQGHVFHQELGTGLESRMEDAQDRGNQRKHPQGACQWAQKNQSIRIATRFSLPTPSRSLQNGWSSSASPRQPKTRFWAASNLGRFCCCGGGGVSSFASFVVGGAPGDLWIRWLLHPHSGTPPWI